MLRGFAFVMTVGIIVGTYSSIYVASPFALLWEKLLRRPGGKMSNKPGSAPVAREAGRTPVERAEAETGATPRPRPRPARRRRAARPRGVRPRSLTPGPLATSWRGGIGSGFFHPTDPTDPTDPSDETKRPQRLRESPHPHLPL